MTASASANKINKYVIAGGGTAGWFSAAILARALVNTGVSIELVESPDIPTIGVGEATIPSIIDVLHYLQIPVRDFIAKTNATFKLGIRFKDWHHLGHDYWHQFGYVGRKIGSLHFYQHWLRYHMNGGEYGFTDFSPSVAMAKANKFHINNPQQQTNLSPSTFALHFDASLVAEYLKKYAIGLGVKHTQANISDVRPNEKGQIDSLVLAGGSSITGDFYIDCTGQAALLIEKALGVKLDNWQKYLPVDSAYAVQTKPMQVRPPYTQATALAHGWQWKIPLQSRTGNGYVFCSKFCDDATAKATLESRLNEEMIAEPRLLRFTTGKRDKIWFKNCLAVGLSSGFLEPLESTSISLIVKGMQDFIERLPDKRLHQATIDEYNRLMDLEYECIRDFIVLHYYQTSRTDSEFWRSWQHAEIPETLKTKVELFKGYGRLMVNFHDLFTEDSWYAVLEGMKVRPNSFDPRVSTSDLSTVSNQLRNMIADLDKSVSQLMSHDAFIERWGKA